MDIHDLKKMSVDLKEGKERLESLKEATLERFEDFKKTCNVLSKLLDEKIATKKLELEAEFREFFESNGFSVETEMKGKHKATFEDTVVILEDNNPDEYGSESIYSFQIPVQRKYDKVVIEAEQKSQGKLYWKNNLKHESHIVGFNNAMEIILSIDDIKELEVLLGKINENIEWCKNAIENFDDINFVYTIYRTDQEFDTFQELFKAL